MKFKYFYIIFIYILSSNLSLSSRENKFIKLSFKENQFIPMINAQINNKNVEIILDNNLHFNFISTKSLDLTDINFHYNNDKININDKTYNAYFYSGDISIFDDKNYIHLEYFNSFVIDDKSIFSSVTISYLLQQLKEESFINKKIFYLDINNKICYFGEIPLYSEKFSDIFYNYKFIHTTFYSNNTKGIFKNELNSLFLGDTYLLKNKIISFYINEYYITLPYSLLYEISKKKIISKSGCNLCLIDNRGIYGIKCPKSNILELPNLYFVFQNNYTFNIPSNLLFEDYDENYKISLFRNKLKYNNIENENIEEDNEEELIIGYSIIKLFNYSIFSYEERSVSFYSEFYIINHPPKFLNKIIYYLLYFLVFLLCTSTSFLIIIKFKMKYIIYKDNIF